MIEQDKALGKGGFCWDAAFCLGEYVIAQLLQQQQQQQAKSASLLQVVELGSGTGLAGMMVAKAVPGLQVHLTDLPVIMPLLTRNVRRNFVGHILPNSHKDDSSALADEPAGLFVGDNHATATNSSSSPVIAQVLDWSDVVTNPQHYQNNNYDVILGADVVASLYDPVALAQTMYTLAHGNTVVYLSFKERLSVMHRQFEAAIAERFEEWHIISSGSGSRNRNPEVQIMYMRRPKNK